MPPTRTRKSRFPRPPGKRSETKTSMLSSPPDNRAAIRLRCKLRASPPYRRPDAAPHFPDGSGPHSRERRLARAGGLALDGHLGAVRARAAGSHAIQPGASAPAHPQDALARGFRAAFGSPPRGAPHSVGHRDFIHRQRRDLAVVDSMGLLGRTLSRKWLVKDSPKPSGLSAWKGALRIPAKAAAALRVT